MPLVSIKIIEGRTKEQKKGMCKDVTEAIVKNIGCPPAAVQIAIEEMKPENVCQGGKMFSESH